MASYGSSAEEVVEVLISPVRRLQQVINMAATRSGVGPQKDQNSKN